MKTKMQSTRRVAFRSSLAPRSSLLAPRTAFTLVELLVVITIIGILAGLITVAAVAALRKAREAEVKAEIDQIATAIEEYKNKSTSYPPNCQTDGPTPEPLDEATILNDLKRHFNQAFPRHREPPELIARLAGLTTAATQLPSGQGLQGGMTAGEALVFWLGGFSSDPKYPISGEGGPSYAVLAQNMGVNIPAGDRHKADPIEKRSWVFPFAISRLLPRDENNEYFDPNSNRYIEYSVIIPGQNNNEAQTRRINFWQYVPRKSEQPYLYFDTSRNPAAVLSGSTVLGPFDPPAATALTGMGPEGDGLHVHALKKIHSNYVSGGTNPPIEFVDPEKFQILHCGIDGEWDVEAFERMSAHEVASTDSEDYLLFPDGPFVGEIADTITNVAPVTRIEDAQP